MRQAVRKGNLEGLCILLSFHGNFYEFVNDDDVQGLIEEACDKGHWDMVKARHSIDTDRSQWEWRRLDLFPRAGSDEVWPEGLPVYPECGGGRQRGPGPEGDRRRLLRLGGPPAAACRVSQRHPPPPLLLLPPKIERLPLNRRSRLPRSFFLLYGVLLVVAAGQSQAPDWLRAAVSLGDGSPSDLLSVVATVGAAARCAAAAHGALLPMPLAG